MSPPHRPGAGRPRIVLLSLCILLGFSVPVLAEAPLIRNTAPQLPPRILELDELWRVGGEEGEFVFGMMIDSVVDDEGSVYLLDNQLCQVEVFDIHGEHLRTVSHEGDGPGEVRVPMALGWMTDGSRGLMELFPSKFVVVERDGTPGSGMTLTIGEDTQTGFMASVSAACRAGVLLSAGQRATPGDGGQDRVQYLSRFDNEGRETTRYCEATTFLSFAPPRFDEVAMLPPFFFANTVGPDGRIYAATERDRYRIEVFLPDGTPDRVIERELDPWRRDDRDRNRMNAMVDAWFQGAPGEIERTLATHEQAVSEMFVDDEGVLWVQHSRSGREQPEGILLSYDTFDAEGNYLQEVSVACEGDPAYDGLKFLGDGRILLIKGYVLARWAATGAPNVDFGEEENDSPMEVICCRVKE